MKAITIRPGAANSAELAEVALPALTEGSLLVRTVALGVCGTDRDILAGLYGEAPQGEPRLILGHESLGVVAEAPAGSGFAPGDHVVGIVRRPDPIPCPACAVGEWDMCRTELYTERGIKGRHGYGAEWFRLEPEFAVRLDESLGLLGVLVEPASIAAKAWDHIDRIGMRTRSWQPRTLLVTGAGPIGLLAAMMGVQRGLEVHVFDRGTGGIKLRLVDGLGAHYHSGDLAQLRLEADILIECTGAVPVIRAVLELGLFRDVLCLLGLPMGAVRAELDLAHLGRTLALRNQVIFGCVNANRRHYEAAVAALIRADRSWLGQLITRRVPLSRWTEAMRDEKEDIKTVISFAAES